MRATKSNAPRPGRARGSKPTPQARIGIVVPDLARRRAALIRTFRALLAPASMLPGAKADALPFNVSLGVALAGYPLVQAALLILELAGREIEFARASLLLRSPFIAAGESEAGARARLDLELRRRAEPMITLERLLAADRRGARERARSWRSACASWPSSASPICSRRARPRPGRARSATRCSSWAFPTRAAASIRPSTRR